MTQDEIIEMARQAGFKMENSAAIQAAKAFAKLIAAKEREACAKVCDELPPVGESKQWERATLKDCAAAIRARGEQA
jgi:hypothetical protein